MLLSVWLSVYMYTLYTATGIYFIWWYLILAIYLICCSVYKIFVPYHGSHARTINTILRESFGTEQCKDRRIRKKASRNSKTHRQELVVVVFIQMLFISCLLVINVRYYMPVFLVNKMSFLKKKSCLFWFIKKTLLGQVYFLFNLTPKNIDCIITKHKLLSGKLNISKLIKSVCNYRPFPLWYGITE